MCYDSSQQFGGVLIVGLPTGMLVVFGKGIADVAMHEGMPAMHSQHR